MRSVLIFGCSLLISVFAFAFTNTNNNSEKKIKETASVNRVENIKALQLTGSVVDDKNKETLAGAAIIVDGKKYYSDLEGQFTITGVNPGKYEVKVELISYEPYITEIDLTKDQKLKVILLQK
ncbi:MAG: carboxypeptidase-like regulatory domain-containing protein [Proteiniphilum sp.]